MALILKTVTLGCKVNQYETEYVREGLLSIGYRDAIQGEMADLCVVNTCTVTAAGEAKSRKIIRRLHRDNPGTQIIVMGCYATRASAEVAALPSVTEVITDKRDLPDLLERLGVRERLDGISRFGTRHRAYVKVQDGCMLRCSYCIIPYMRKHVLSRPVDSVLAEIERLITNGYREIVLTGIHLGHYGVDFNHQKPKDEWVRLANLLEKITQLDGDFRVRLSSIEATELTRELLAVMEAAPRRICPHLHVSMQSGSDEILQKMNRRWGARRFIDRCQWACERLDRPAMTTDVIVGFPGETEADFEATCEAVRQIGFSKLHVFPFSPREGTPAATMPNQIPHHIKTQRLQHLAEIEQTLRKNYFRSLLGMPLRVLAESPVENHLHQLTGTSCRYAPVTFPGSPDQCGQLIEVIAETYPSDPDHSSAIVARLA